MSERRLDLDVSLISSESRHSSNSANRKRRIKNRKDMGGEEEEVTNKEMDAMPKAEDNSRGMETSRSLRKGSVRSSSRRQQQQTNSEDELSGTSSTGAAAIVTDKRGNRLDPHHHDHRRHSLSQNNQDDNSARSLLELLSVRSGIHPQTREEKMAQAIRKFRLLCGRIVEHPRVQLGIIILIIVNSIIMGIATFDFVTDDPENDEAFDKTDRVFLVLFTVEMILQLFYRSVTFFTDPWLLFDFAVVIISWSIESLQLVRAFRIFRAFRLVTRIGPLRELVMAIGAVMPRMYAIAMLLFLIFYIFAVLFTELFSELELSGNYFGSLDASLFTCMQMMTLEWAQTAREVMDQKSWAWAPIFAFISVTGFIVFNLIVAVVCDAVAVVDREVQAEKHPELLSDKEKIIEAQERIWELTETVEILMMRQERLLGVVDLLSKEVRAAVMSPGAAAATRQNPMLRSAMKNSNRDRYSASVSESTDQIADPLHFSDDEEGEDGSEQDKFNDRSERLEKDVQNAIKRLTLGRMSDEEMPTGSSHERNSLKPVEAQEKARQTKDLEKSRFPSSAIERVQLEI